MSETDPDPEDAANWEEACRREDAVRKFVLGRDGNRKSATIKELAQELRLSRATAYRMLEIRRLIREMSIANPLWGAPRVHGELLKLGIEIGQTSVAKYMVRRRGPPSQGWKTFLRNHADGIVAMDLFVVPTISFRLLYGLLIIGHGRRSRSC